MAQIKRTLLKDYSSLNGVILLKSDDIQGMNI